MNKRATMVEQAKKYLADRRSLGFALDVSGKLLMQFARFADRSKHRGPLTTDLALRWASLPKTASARYRAERLSIVRGFARHLVAEDGRSQVPDRRLLGQKPLSFATPHLQRPRTATISSRGRQTPAGLSPSTPHIQCVIRAVGQHRLAGFGGIEARQGAR